MANKPNNPSLWSKAKSLAKQKFDVYPSAYANGWAAKWYKGKGGTWRKAMYGMEIPMMEQGGKPEWLLEAQLKAQGYSGDALQQKLSSMAEGGTNNPGFKALPEYVQAKILSNMQLGGPAIPFSPEFFDQLKNEYNQFYNVKPPYRPIEDDGYDAFFKYKKKNLPPVLYSQGPGWLVKNEDREMFFRGEKGLPMPKNVEKKTGTKTFFEDFKMMGDNPQLMQYAAMIDKLVRDKRGRVKAPIEQAFKFQKGGEPDGEMALGQLAAVVDKMNKLRQFIQPDSDLEPWISSKLAVMDHYADAVSDYMMYNPEAREEEEEYDEEEMEMMEGGGYTVTRSDDRKGKTHKVTGPDGTVKYFGDSKLGQHPKDPERKAAFYARHKKNLDGNPYFRAFARATWADGGETFDLPKYQTAGWIERAANAQLRRGEKCQTFGDPYMGGGGGGRGSNSVPQYKDRFEALADLSNDAWFGKEEIKGVNKSRPSGVDRSMWNAINAEARRVNNSFTNKAVWGENVNPATGRLDDKYLAEEYRQKINIPEYYRYYNNTMKDKKSITPEDLYQYYSSQPGGLEMFRTLINNNYQPKQKNGGYIGADGKRYISNTPTWSGNMGYQNGGEPLFPLAIPGSLWHANWEPSEDYETVDPMMEQFNQDAAAMPAPKVAMNVPASSAAAPVDYKGVSIVDMLSSMGKASDYNSRKQLAAELGIDNYYGGADQNLKMIKKIASNPSVLNDYTAAPVRKPSSSKKKSSPRVPALPVTEPTASMFSPNMYANAKAAYLAAHPGMTSEQYDAMANSGKRTEVRENSKSLSEKAVAGKYDDKYFMRNMTPLNTDYRTQEAFNDAVLNMFTDQIPSAVLAAAGPGIVNSVMKRLITTEMLPYGLRMIPEVVSKSRNANRALPYATRALPYKEGGSINLDPAKKGTFKAQATRMGMGVQEAAAAILNAPEGKYSPEMRKKANFARNFAKQSGGIVEGAEMEVTPEQAEILRAQGYDFEII
jgi:hypothetical protein